MTTKRNKKKKQQFLGSFEEWVVLAILATGNDSYGVPIARAIEELSGKRVSTGALYTTLARLKEKGIVTADKRAPERQRGGRAKTYYKVDATGFAILKQSLERKYKIYKESGLAIPGAEPVLA